MATMIVLVSGQANADFPAILEAARVFPAATRLGCDRIRVEKADGARVADYPLATVRAFIRRTALVVQPDRVARRDFDYEDRCPVWALGQTKTKETS